LEIHSPGTKNKMGRPLRPTAVHAFREFVTNCDWSFILSTSDVNDKVNAFLEFTQVSIDSFFPIKTFKLYEDDKPFITGRLKKLMAKRNKAHKSGNFELSKRLRNQIVAEVRSAKNNFYHNHVRPTFCKNPHFWWKNVNKIIGKKKQSITLFDPQTEHPMDEKQAAEYINEFVASLTEDFIEVQNKWLDGGSSEPLPVISEESVEKKLKGLSVRKASGPYDPNIKVLKMFAKNFAIPLTNIFNESFRSRIFPKIKYGNVITFVQFQRLHHAPL
jgi:hypothetical protein